jgi:hypothetical protein
MRDDRPSAPDRRSVSCRARRVGSITPSTASIIIPSAARYTAWRSPRREMRSTQRACISRRVMLLTVPRLTPSAADSWAAVCSGGSQTCI